MLNESNHNFEYPILTAVGFLICTRRLREQDSKLHLEALIHQLRDQLPLLSSLTTPNPQIRSFHLITDQ